MLTKQNQIWPDLFHGLVLQLATGSHPATQPLLNQRGRDVPDVDQRVFLNKQIFIACSKHFLGEIGT